MRETPVQTPQPAHSEPVRPVGFVGLAGLPNVGKSTLVNRLVGQKISIVSKRPQTTRQRICGIYTDSSMQAVLVDLPGIVDQAGPFESTGVFNKHLVDWAAFGLARCDLVLHLRDARRPDSDAEQPVIAMIRKTRSPVWLVWNKIDLIGDRTSSRRLEGCSGPPDFPYARTFAVSARTARGLDALRGAIAETLPAGPLLYDPDQLCDCDLRWMAAELVREQLFRHLGAEVPYGAATQTETFDEDRPDPVYIRVVIISDRRAHKPIIIGKGGAMLKRIGQKARLEIERLLGRPVYLDLWVKIRPKWRKDENQMAGLGLSPPVSY